MLKISFSLSTSQTSDSQLLSIVLLLAFLDLDVSVKIGGGKLSIGEELVCALFNKSLYLSESSGVILPTVSISMVALFINELIPTLTTKFLVFHTQSAALQYRYFSFSFAYGYWLPR